MIRAVETINTSEGRFLVGQCVALPPNEAVRFVDAGKAVVPEDIIETASFVQPLPHHKRERRYRKVSDADRLATNNCANK